MDHNGHGICFFLFLFDGMLFFGQGSFRVSSCWDATHSMGILAEGDRYNDLTLDILCNDMQKGSRILSSLQLGVLRGLQLGCNPFYEDHRRSARGGA